MTHRLIPWTVSVLALLACAPGAASVVTAPDPLCAVDPAGAVTGPQSTLCQALVDRYATLIDTTAIAGRAELVDGVAFRMTADSSGAWVMLYSRSGLFPKSLTSPPKPYETEVFWHEIGHQWLVPLMRGGRRISTTYTYGTEAPDWFDEAWAVWAEPAGKRARRLDQLPTESRPSLRSLVEMPHPASGTAPQNSAESDDKDPIVGTSSSTDSPCPGCDWLPDSLRLRYRTVTIRRRASGWSDTVETSSATRPTHLGANDTVEQRYFYPLAYSLLRYIRETGGTAAVRELIARYRRDPVPVAATLEGLPGMPASLNALEAGWHAFLAERRPEPK